jgi:nucleoside diphosphate kinase
MYKKDASEYALLLVKPDGNEKGLLENILGYLAEYGNLTEVHRNYFRLSVSQVSDTFIHIYNDRKYKSYMTRGPLTAVLLQGQNAVYKLRVLKSSIRKMYSTDVMENIIHSSEVGNEYDLQFRTFFPNLDVNKFSLFADLYLKTNFSFDYEKFSVKMKKIEENSSAKAIAHIFNNDVFLCNLDNIRKFHLDKGFTKFTLIGLEYNTKIDDQDIKILGYYKIDSVLKLTQAHYKYNYHDLDEIIHLINSNGGAAFIGYTNQMLKLKKEVFEDIAMKGIKGGIVYHPQYTLEQTELLREKFLDSNLITSGGSGGIAECGRYSVSYEIFNELFKLLYGEDYINASKLINFSK